MGWVWGSVLGCEGRYGKRYGECVGRKTTRKCGRSEEVFGKCGRVPYRAIGGECENVCWGVVEVKGEIWLSLSNLINNKRNQRLQKFNGRVLLNTARNYKVVQGTTRYF